MLERTILTTLLSSICRYEKEHDLPFQYLNVAITAQGHGGAFQVRPPVRIQRQDRTYCLQLSGSNYLITAEIRAK